MHINGIAPIDKIIMPYKATDIHLQYYLLIIINPEKANVSKIIKKVIN